MLFLCDKLMSYTFSTNFLDCVNPINSPSQAIRKIEPVKATPSSIEV